MDTKDEFYKMTYRLVGVTFDNEDGTNRQKLLDDIKFFHGSNGVDYQKGELKLELVKYKYNNEDAICLRAGIFNDILGNISRNDLPFLIENYDNIVDIPFLDISGGNPRGCTFTVTFKNPDYMPPVSESMKTSEPTAVNSKDSRFVTNSALKMLNQKHGAKALKMYSTTFMILFIFSIICTLFVLIFSLPFALIFGAISFIAFKLSRLYKKAANYSE